MISGRDAKPSRMKAPSGLSQPERRFPGYYIFADPFTESIIMAPMPFICRPYGNPKGRTLPHGLIRNLRKVIGFVEEKERQSSRAAWEVTYSISRYDR